MLAVHPARPVEPLHPAFTPEAVADLVERFYAAVRADARLGPIFDARIGDRWPAHLDRMKTFWRAVLRREGGFKGQPVQAHRALTEVRSDDYDLWLRLFRAVAQERFPAEAARIVIATAERIAESLWLAAFGGPFTPPPAFLRAGRPIEE